MGHYWVGAALIVVTVPGPATAQTAARLEVGPVVRVENVTVRAGVSQVMPVYGAAARVRLSQHVGIEGELTQASSHEFSSSREFISESFAPPGATLAEIERLGVHVRYREGYRAGLGGTVAVTLRDDFNRHAGFLLRAGISSRTYTVTTEQTVISIPEGIDPRRLATFSFGNGNRSSNPFTDTSQRGGLLLGAEVPLRVHGGLSIAPEVRAVVLGGSSYTGDRHRELSAGVRLGWAF